MKYVVVVARVLLGLVFLVLGLEYFFHFLGLEGEPPSGHAAAFAGALAATGYMNVVKVLEVAGGALVLTGRFTPLGLVLLTPVVVNIILFDVFLTKAFNPIAAGVAVLTVFLLVVYRNNFRGIFARPTA